MVSPREVRCSFCRRTFTKGCTGPRVCPDCLEKRRQCIVRGCEEGKKEGLSYCDEHLEEMLEQAKADGEERREWAKEQTCDVCGVKGDSEEKGNLVVVDAAATHVPKAHQGCITFRRGDGDG